LQTHTKVAIKLIYQTVALDQICSEILFLQIFRNKKHFSNLLDVFVHESSVHLVFEYFKFDSVAKIQNEGTLDDIKNYMKQLLTCLNKINKYGIVHRDVKHLNFLYNMKAKRGILIDFGAAEVL
jgi:serine/threonine protein kinase